MKIFLLITIIIFLILFVGKKVFYSAKRNLFKDQAAWAVKDINIKYSNPKETSKSKGIDNYLNIIAEESKTFLEDESEKEEEKE